MRRLQRLPHSGVFWSNGLCLWTGHHICTRYPRNTTAAIGLRCTRIDKLLVHNLYTKKDNVLCMRSLKRALLICFPIMCDQRMRPNKKRKIGRSMNCAFCFPYPRALNICVQKYYFIPFRLRFIFSEQCCTCTCIRVVFSRVLEFSGTHLTLYTISSLQSLRCVSKRELISLVCTTEPHIPSHHGIA